MTPEGHIKAAVKKRLNQLGAYHHWPVINGMGAPCLDCHGCYQGLYFAIETKRPGGKLTARQQITAQEITDAGGVVMIVDTKEQADGLTFDPYIKAKPPPAGPV